MRRLTAAAWGLGAVSGRAAVVLAVLGVLLVGVGAGSYAAVTNVRGWEDSREAAPNAIFKGGPIRVGPRVYAHGNSTHAVVGVRSVKVVGCNLVLELDHQPGQRVMAAVVEEDETISRLGIQAGLSGGGPKGTISFYKNGRKVCANSRVFGSLSNVWVSIVTIDGPAQP